MAYEFLSCTSCGASLEPDAVCLACLLGEALVAEDSQSGEKVESSFGDFASPTAGVFGKYILRRKLGEGGMGVIWEAEDTTLRRVVALKMIRGFAFSSDVEKRRFQTEASAVAQLDHPNIVPIYEVGDIDEQPYFTMKLLDGGTLTQHLKDGAMKARNAVGIMEKLARAIHHAHQRGVLHRDLKPDNVLFDKSGEPYLTDFGLAKLLDSSSGLTLTHAHIGTPQYMSPEQARGRASDITAASDVWAAGALFYHMLTGRIPFPGTSSGEILHRVANEAPAAMQSSAMPVDKELETLCRRCLKRDPAQRLGSAEELADELRRWLDGEPIRSKRWKKRYLWRVAAGAAVLSSVVAASMHLSSINEIESSAEVSTVGNIMDGDIIHLCNQDDSYKKQTDHLWLVVLPEELKMWGITGETNPADKNRTDRRSFALTAAWEQAKELAGQWRIRKIDSNGGPLKYGDMVYVINRQSYGSALDIADGVYPSLQQGSDLDIPVFITGAKGRQKNGDPQTACSASWILRADTTGNATADGELVDITKPLSFESGYEKGYFLKAHGWLRDIKGEVRKDIDYAMIFAAPPGKGDRDRGTGQWEVKLFHETRKSRAAAPNVVTMGDAIGLQNMANQEYLNTCGYVSKTSFGNHLPTQNLHVFTSEILNEDGYPFGTWAIESAEGKAEGTPLCYGDVVHLENKYPDAGWLDSCGLVKSFESFAEFASRQQAFVSTSKQYRHADGTDQWTVLDENGQASGDPVELQDQILLKSRFGEEGGYLNAMGKVSGRSEFPDSYFQRVSSLVFVGHPGEPRKEDFWRVVDLSKTR